MSEQPKGDGNNTDASRDDSSHGDVLAEKKRIARRQILTGAAAAGAVLGSTSRARAIGVSVCFSFTDVNPALQQEAVNTSAFVQNLGECESEIEEITD